MSEPLLDAAGRRRSPATLPQLHSGRPLRNKGMRYPADPPTIEEIVTVMRCAGDGVHGRRLRGLIVVLWRAGLRIHEALALAEADLDARRGSLLVRRAKGGRRREVGMDDWAWEQLAPWLDVRVELPVGPLFCVVNGATRGRPWAAAAARTTPTRSRWPRGRAADRHPTPARPHQPRHHLRLPPGHRQHRDHRDCPRPPRADGPLTGLRLRSDERSGPIACMAVLPSSAPTDSGWFPLDRPGRLAQELRSAYRTLSRTERSMVSPCWPGSAGRRPAWALATIGRRSPCPVRSNGRLSARSAPSVGFRDATGSLLETAASAPASGQERPDSAVRGRSLSIRRMQ
jgi:Phage integrase family